MNESSLAQSPILSEKLIQVDLYDGYLSISARNVRLVELMQKVGTEAGFRVITFGKFSNQTSSWSMSKVPLFEAIKKILNGSSAIISHHQTNNLDSNTKISTLYLIGSWSRTTNATDVKSVELPDRLIAVERLQGLTDEITVNSLLFTLRHDPDPIVRNHAVILLEKIGGTSGVTALASGLGDDDPSVRTRVVQALGKIADERTSLWLGQALKGDPSSDVRLQAVFSIANKNNALSKLFLEAALDDNSEKVSNTAMQLLKTRQ